MKRIHAMPFGVTADSSGRTSFRLWAPGAQSVDLRLDVGEMTTARMCRDARGWFSTSVSAAVGGLYQYVIDGDLAVPDPASRFQPRDVHGPSQIVDPASFDWRDESWRGRPWHETVLYELHVGTFTPQGTYAAAAAHLDDLAALGITAVELMPLSESPGAHNWGYDGVLPFAPEHRYGLPDDLKRFVEAAHRRGLMVFLDVVYNHFGPEGNYLHRYAPQFFTERHQTPWGAGINFDGPESGLVRDFFVHNALYWIEEFNIDGLRLDAVHAILDDSETDILDELARRVREAVAPDRHVHLVLENDDNAARYLARDKDGNASRYTAQWNDDLHHILHVLATGESAAYYSDYTGEPAARLGRALAQGFDYQGEPSAHRGGRSRGEPSAHLPATAFVSFLQNHDQIGNRAKGERIGAIAPREAVRAATAIVALAPAPPLLFMGEEWDAPHPFLFFCDFGPDLADAVREGRRREFARFPEFADPAARAAIPDPLAIATFEASTLDWSLPATVPRHREWRDFVRQLLEIRHREIVPRLPGLRGGSACHTHHGDSLIDVRWILGDGSTLQAVISMSPHRVKSAGVSPLGRPLFLTAAGKQSGSPHAHVPPWFVGWYLDDRKARV